MKRVFFSLPFLMFSAALFSQHKPIKRSWVRTSVEDFTGKASEPDTLYTRYEFDNTTLTVGFEPGWNFVQMPYSIQSNFITIGFDTWILEHLSDSVLTIHIKGFKRMKFVAEELLSQKDEYLQLIGEYKGKPLYKSNRYITPRYKKANSLGDDIRKQDIVDHYNVRKATTFLISFIITEEGKVENPKVLKGIVEGYDKGVINELLKTSKRWRPALHKGRPVQTLMYYEVKFLDSLTDH